MKIPDDHIVKDSLIEAPVARATKQRSSVKPNELRAALIVAALSFGFVSNIGAADRKAGYTFFFAARVSSGSLPLAKSKFIEQAAVIFRSADKTRDGLLSAEDKTPPAPAAEMGVVERAEARVAGSVLAASVIARDVANRGYVTRDEIEAGLRQFLGPNPTAGDDVRAQANALIERELGMQMAADINKDGKITWEEAALYWLDPAHNPKIQPNRFDPAQFANSLIDEILLFAKPGRKDVSIDEVAEAAGRLFDEIDVDHDGFLSQVERADYLKVAKRDFF